MNHTQIPHLPIYEGDEDPIWHWFICETIWDVANIVDENKQLAQFIGALRKRALNWYMNFNEY